jgi:DNA-binding CsgD family transcriptional regulator
MTNLLKDFRHIFLYGLILSVLIFILKWMQWKFLIVDHSTDIYVGLIAVFFTGLGVWIATQLTKTKVRTVIIEKEVYKTRPGEFTINETELQKLKLSSREYEILQLLSKGYSNSQIAEVLFLSVSTIKTHTSNLYFKLEVKNRMQAVERAKQLGIIA